MITAGPRFTNMHPTLCTPAALLQSLTVVWLAEARNGESRAPPASAI